MAGFVNVDGVEIDVVRQKGRKRMSLRINRKSGRAELSLPLLCPTFLATRFVREHIVWLKKSLELTPGKQTFQYGSSFELLGQELTICPTDEKKGVFIENDKLYVSGQPEFCHRRVKDFIKKQFYDYVCEKAQDYARQTDKKIAHITIRDTSSRWGSCSGSGGLSFCWRLALAPTFVIDYVIAHEVAHLTYMNHSAFFWAKVRQINADSIVARKWLKDKGGYLHSFV